MTTDTPICDTCGHAEGDHSRLAGCTAVPVGKAFCTCSKYVAPAAPPVTPYDGGTSSGHSGTDTSAARAQREDGDGTTKRRQQHVLNLLGSDRGGVTVKELRNMTGWHHGQASAVLSNLHQGGLIARLSVVRDRCKVYVLPSQVNDRDTEPHGTRQSKANGRKTQGQVTLTTEEAAAVGRVGTRALSKPDENGKVVVSAADLVTVLAALRARDDKPARRG